MKNTFLIILNVFVLSFYSNSQIIEKSIEFEAREVYLGIIKDNKLNTTFSNLKLIKEENETKLYFKQVPFKHFFSFRYNLLKPNDKEISFGFGFCNVQHFGKYFKDINGGSLLISAPFKRKYIQLEFKYSKREEVQGKFFLSYGIKLATGLLFNQQKTVKVSSPIEEVKNYNQFINAIYVVDNVNDYNLKNYSKVFNINLRYFTVVYYELNDKISFYFGGGIPLIRLFFYNTTMFQTGVELNIDDFFTQFKSYVFNDGDSESLNKNFAFSLKKSQATSLNFGIKYNLQSKSQDFKKID